MRFTKSIHAAVIVLAATGMATPALGDLFPSGPAVDHYNWTIAKFKVEVPKDSNNWLPGELGGPTDIARSVSKQYGDYPGPGDLTS